MSTAWGLLGPLLLLLAPFSWGCQDEQGRSVDYFLLYKVPKLENSPNSNIRSGLGYAFVTANSADKWQLSNRSIGDPKSLLGTTLKTLYGSGKNNILLYNDQPPPSYSASSRGASSAHAKGIFYLNTKSGFYLSHSVPRFLDLKQKSFQYPDSGKENGQVLICISLAAKDSSSIANIGQHLLLLKTNVYSYNFTDAFTKKYPAFKDLINKKWSKNQTQISEIYSSKRVKFTLFSKSNKFQKDIYSQMIAPYVKEDLLVQTWRNGAGEKLNSDCKDQYRIMNIDQIKLQSNIDWKYTEDHAKWAVSVQTKGKPTLTCVSDLNRMRSQFSRGGGSICLQLPAFWSIFSASVENIEACPRTSSQLVPPRNQTSSSSKN